MHPIAAMPWAQAAGWRKTPTGRGDMTQALIRDSLAYKVTLSKSLNCSGLVFLCRMKNRL